MDENAGSRLRRATAKDAAAIAGLTRDAYEKWVPLIGRAPKPMTADYDIAVRDHLIDVLDGVEGLIALIETIPEADHLLIENLAVAPACQGRGYGLLLIAHAETLARSLGHPEIRLYTNKLFAANIAFYRKRGFRVDVETAFKGGFITHMSRRI